MAQVYDIAGRKEEVTKVCDDAAMVVPGALEVISAPGQISSHHTPFRFGGVYGFSYICNNGFPDIYCHRP